MPEAKGAMIDAVDLPSSSEPSVAADDCAPPQSGLEIALARIWAEVLGMERVGIQDNFFELGGNSLAALRIVARVYDATGVRVSARTVFDSPTLAHMAARVKELSGTGTAG